MSLDLLLEAGSLAKASSPEPFSTSKTSNWVARKGGLPPYVQHIAHDLMEKRGMPESRAIAMAIGIVKNPPANWGPEAKAAAAKAHAEWEAKKGVSGPGAAAKSAIKRVAEGRRSSTLSLADTVALRNAAQARMAAVEDALGVQMVSMLLEAAPSGAFAPELKRTASASSESMRYEVHHGGQHVGYVMQRPGYGLNQGERWSARAVNGQMAGEMASSKGEALTALRRHLEEAPARVSEMGGKHMVAEPQSYSGETRYREFPSMSAARYAAGLPEKETALEKASKVRALSEMVACDGMTLLGFGGELPVGLSEASFQSAFDEAKHPRGAHGRFTHEGLKGLEIHHHWDNDPKERGVGGRRMIGASGKRGDGKFGAAYYHSNGGVKDVGSSFASHEEAHAAIVKAHERYAPSARGARAATESRASVEARDHAARESMPRISKNDRPPAKRAARATTASAHAAEMVNYGGVPTPRGEVYNDVLRKAERAGHPNPKASADRYMQGLANTHGGYKVGDKVSHRPPSIVNGKVEGYGPPRAGEVVGFQRNGNLRIREPAFGTTVDVHHSKVTRRGRVQEGRPALLGALLESDRLVEKAFSADRRRELAKKGHALPDGSYPIESAGDLENAARLARSGHGNADAARRHIAKRAKQLGVSNPLAG